MPKQKRQFKAPNRRRIKKWLAFTRRSVYRAEARGFAWYMQQVFRIGDFQRAADKVGVDLSAQFEPLPPLTRDTVDALCKWMGVPVRIDHDRCYPAEVPTRENLEI